MERKSKTVGTIDPKIDALLSLGELLQYAAQPQSREQVVTALRETGLLKEPQPLTREQLLAVCEELAGGSIKDGAGMAADFCSKVRATIAAGDANEAALAGFMLGALSSMTMIALPVSREARRLLGKLTFNETTMEQAAEDRDRVAVLVNRKGTTPADAKKQVAKERGVDLRTIQRHCRKKRHD
jgi:hypothetical protein